MPVKASWSCKPPSPSCQLYKQLTHDYRRRLREKLLKIPGISCSNYSFALRSLKETTSLLYEPTWAGVSAEVLAKGAAKGRKMCEDRGARARGLSRVLSVSSSR